MEPPIVTQPYPGNCMTCNYVVCGACTILYCMALKDIHHDIILSLIAVFHIQDANLFSADRNTTYS